MKSASKNMILAIISRVVTIITGIVVQRYILLTFGSVLNGLTSSITQVMSYLVLLEAGLGSASIQALYNPLAQNDWKKISGIITATGQEYKKISAVFVSCLFCVAIVLPFTTINEVEYSIAALLTLITGASSIASYILGGKYKALLNADRKVYILYYLDIMTTILSAILRIVALRVGMGIVIVQLLNLFTVGIKNLGYLVYVRNKYQNINYNAEPDIKSISKRWNVLIHSLSGIVVNHTDIIILTIFSSLKTVSLYSVYNMVFGQMSNMIQIVFTQAPQASFGRIFNQDKEKFKKLYLSYETFFTVLLFIVVAISFVMILPFIRIYTSGINDIQYVDSKLQVLFVLILLMNQLRVPAIMAINISGYFKETQRGAIIEAIINIVASLFLFFVMDFGIYGLLLGTIISYLYRTLDVILFVYKKILRLNIVKFIKMLFINLICLAFSCYIFGVRYPVITNGVTSWLIMACIRGCVISMIFFIGNLIGNKKTILEGLDNLKHHIL